MPVPRDSGIERFSIIFSKIIKILFSKPMRLTIFSFFFYQIL